MCFLSVEHKKRCFEQCSRSPFFIQCQFLWSVNLRIGTNKHHEDCLWRQIRVGDIPVDIRLDITGRDFELSSLSRLHAQVTLLCYVVMET